MKARKFWFGLTILLILTMLLYIAWPRPPQKVDVAKLPHYVKELSTPNWPLWQWKLCSFLRRKPFPSLKIRTPDQRRARAAEAIRELGEKARPASDAILPLLFNADTSACAGSALLGIGITPESLPQLSRAATNQSAMVRMNCVPLLRALMPGSRDAVSLCIGLLNDPDNFVRHAAVNALEGMEGDPTEAALALVERLNDSNPNVRRDATGVLSLYGNRATNALPALRKVLETKTGDEKRFIETLALANILSTNPPTGYFRPSTSIGTNSSRQNVGLE